MYTNISRHDPGVRTAEVIIEDLETWYDRDPWKRQLGFLWASVAVSLTVGVVAIVLYYEYGWGGMDWTLFLTYNLLLLFLVLLSVSSLKGQAIAQAHEEERSALLNDQVVRYLSMHSDGIMATGLPVSPAQPPEPPPMYTVVINAHDYDSLTPNSSQVPTNASSEDAKLKETTLNPPSRDLEDPVLNSSREDDHARSNSAVASSSKAASVR